MNSYTKCYIFFLTALFVLSTMNGYADPSATCQSGEVLSGFQELVALAHSEKQTVDLEKLSPILDFVSSDNPECYPECKGGIDNAPMAFYGFDVSGGMERMARYCFNPEIPTYAIMPNMVRYSLWRDQEQKSSGSLPLLWTRLKDFKDPQVFHSFFYMENTPDPHTGAYYGYDSYRTIILTRYKGRIAIISILKQKDVSDVGRKGFMVGDDKDMDYFYSGEEGLNLMGLGWVKSYLYDSFSVAVFLEKGQGKGLRCGTFKWLRAGWAGKNMVRKVHILEGLKRYASVFSHLMAADDYPKPSELAEICSRFDDLPSLELKKRMEDYIVSLQGKCSCNSGCPKLLKKNFNMDHYIDSLSPLEMRAALVVDYIRHSLAKERAGNVACWPKSGDVPVF